MARAAAIVPAFADLPAQPSRRIERFFATKLHHGKGRWDGRPFVLEPWQIDDVVRPIFDTLRFAPARDFDRPTLIREYTEALVGIPRKNGKTHVAAGLGLYGLAADGYFELDGDRWIWIPEGGAEVYNIAGSKDQAKILFALGSQMVMRDPSLRTLCKVYRDAIEIPETGAVWRVLASDAPLAHGLNPSIAIIDEIWTHRDPELYDAFATAGGARAQPLLLTITTAGFDRTSIAFKLYQRGKRGRSRRFYFVWWAADEKASISNLTAIKAGNPSRWITKRYLADELERARALGLENSFLRLHANRWTNAREQAFPLAAWDAGATKPFRIPDRAEVTVAVDVAPKRDSTGVVVDWRDDHGRHWIEVHKMTPDPDTGYLDFDALKDLLRLIWRTFTVRNGIYYDPAHLTATMLDLAEEGLIVVEFPQTDLRMVPASMTFHDLMTSDRLRHLDDDDLRGEVQAAAKKETERGWRVHKRTSSGIIDGIVAAIMAAWAWEGTEAEPEPPTPSIGGGAKRREKAAA